MTIALDKELINPDTIASMCDAYATAQKEVAEAYATLDRAKKRLSASGLGDNVMDRNAHGYNIGYDAKNIAKIIKKNAWHKIIERSQVKNLMTVKRSEELYKQVESGEIPEISIATVLDFMNNFSSSMRSLLHETIQETFNILRPRCSSYKTNTEYAIGKRVILTGIVDCNYYMCLNYTRDQNLRCIDNAFHLMDGKGPIKYPGDMTTKIQAAMNDKLDFCETEYFKCKWYMKGTLHIEFKRMDLVAKLNKMAGGNKLGYNKV
ncbi:MAG: DUF4942 domain-containing protein [Eubacteriales bacterium]